MPSKKGQLKRGVRKIAAVGAIAGMLALKPAGIAVAGQRTGGRKYGKHAEGKAGTGIIDRILNIDVSKEHPNMRAEVRKFKEFLRRNRENINPKHLEKFMEQFGIKHQRTRTQLEGALTESLRKHGGKPAKGMLNDRLDKERMEEMVKPGRFRRKILSLTPKKKGA